MSLLLPIDDNGNPVHVLGFAPKGTRKISVGGASVRTAEPLPPAIQLITLISTGPCRFEVGNHVVSADATLSPFLFPGQYVDVPLRHGERHVAFVAEEASCIVYVIGRI